MEPKINKPQLRFRQFNEGWHSFNLKELSESFEYGLNVAAIGYDGKNKYLRITDIDEHSHLFNKSNLTSPGIDLSKAENYKLKSGDVLFARTGASVGKTYIYKKIDGRVYYAGFLIRARIKPEVNSEFIFQSTLTNKYQNFVRHTSQRSGQPGINAQEYSHYQLLIPKKEEQSKIGSYFQHLDNLINLHQKKHDKLVILKKAMLSKMFPKQGHTVPEIRFKGFEGAWKKRKLGDIGSTYTGLSGKNKDDFGHGHGKFITYMNVFSHSVSNKNMTEPIEIDNTQNEVQFGDVFFTTSSETPDEVGMSSVWLEHTKNVYLNSFCFGYRPVVEFDNFFLAYLLRSTAVRKKITFLAQGISRYNISKTKVMEIIIPLPEIIEQEKIGKYFQNLEQLISLHKTELDKLKNFKKACLEKMFV